MKKLLNVVIFSLVAIYSCTNKSDQVKIPAEDTNRHSDSIENISGGTISLEFDTAVAMNTLKSVQKDFNLYDTLQKLKSKFPYKNLREISTHKYVLNYGKHCEINHCNFEVHIPELDSELSKAILRQSKLYLGSGHFFSFYQFNPNIIIVIIAVHGHYDTPGALLFTINNTGKIIGERKVAGEFFDAGQGNLTKAKIEGENILTIIDKDLDERPLGDSCKAKLQIFQILKNGKLDSIKTITQSIDCYED